MDKQQANILLVEDEEAHAQLIRRAFESHSQPLTLTVAYDLHHARHHITQSAPNLIIADWRLPDGQGIELLPADRKNSPYPVVIMTSHGDEQMAVEAMRAGALDYVVKSEETMAQMPHIAQRALREWGYITDRRQAEEALHRRNRELALLNRVIAASAASPEPEAILEIVCRELAQTFALTQVIAGLMNKEKTTITVVADYSPADSPSLLNLSVPVANSPFIEYMLTNQSFLLAEDAQNDPRLATVRDVIRRRGTVSLLMLPLIIDNDIVGGLSLASTEPRSFSTEEISLVQSIAEQVAGAMARSQLAEERRQLQEQYHQSQKLETIGTLAAGVAHDFNNLLLVINGFAELLQMEIQPDDPNREPVDKILHAGKRAAELVSQLLAFSRKQIISPQIVNLASSISHTEKMLHRIISENIQLSTFIAPDLWPVRIDPAQIEQIIVNLAVNARDAMPDGGQLTIEAANVVLDDEYAARHLDTSRGDHVLIAVSDTGQGMNKEMKARIFDPFFTTKEVGKGTGLGLATVFGIVKQNKGNIWVYSEENIGTTFKVYLPRAEVSAPPQPTDSKIGQEFPLGNETILLVEDDTGVRKLAQMVLQSQGYTVLEAKDGQQALQLFAEHTNPIHLLVTDVIMPGMSGKDLADVLTQQQPDLKTLYISGYTDKTIVRHGVLDPDVTFLQKPFSPKTLAHKVRAILDS